jgi:DNA-binding NarL/FixJ family response regulator
MQDTSWFGQRIVENLASLTRNRAVDGAGPKVSDLTPRARDVLVMVAQGLSDAEIADRITVSRNTVRNHVSAIYRATGIHKRNALVVWARERGLGVQEKSKPKQRRGNTR